MIVYPNGDWFGTIDERDVNDFKEYFINDEIEIDIKKYWRGKINLQKQEQIDFIENKEQYSTWDPSK